MRFSEVVLGCLIAAACVGCPGTIEDPASFEELGQAAKLDAGGSGYEDAALEDADVLDAAAQEDAAHEAGSAEDSGRAQDAASSTPDAARTDAAASVDAAGAGSEAGPGCDFRALITAKCGSSGCHGAPAVSNGLDLTSPDLSLRLAGKRGSGACSSYLLIDATAPAQSALYLKVTPDACGSRMPLGGTLTDGEQACILRWIESLQ
jgi:hypothetical protein